MIWRMGQFLVRAGFTGIALWIVTLILPRSIYFVGGEGDLVKRIGIIVVVALIFGVVNAFIKPIVQFVAIPLYILTLGLIQCADSGRPLIAISIDADHSPRWRPAA